MKFDDSDDYIDRVAQAVIDKIEERDTVNQMVNLVAQRVVELQAEAREEAALKAQSEPNSTQDTKAEDK